MKTSTSQLLGTAVCAAVLMAATSAPAAAQGLFVGFDVNFPNISVGNEEGAFSQGHRSNPAPGAVLGFTFGGEESEDFGFSADFRMQARSTRIQLEDGRTTTFREGFLSDFTFGEGVMIRVKNVSGGFFLDQRLLGRGTSFVDIGSIASGNLLFGMGYVGKVNIGSTRITQLQFQWVNYFGGDMADAFDTVPLERGREWRITAAHMFKPRMGVRGEYLDSRLDFQQRLFNVNGAFDHRASNLSLGMIFILF